MCIKKMLENKLNSYVVSTIEKHSLATEDYVDDSIIVIQDTIADDIAGEFVSPNDFDNLEYEVDDVQGLVRDLDDDVIDISDRLDDFINDISEHDSCITFQSKRIAELEGKIQEATYKINTMMFTFLSLSVFLNEKFTEDKEFIQKLRIVMADALADIDVPFEE